METNITQALQILVIGMGTVFVILALVVFLSRILIQVVNSYSRPAKRMTITSPTQIPDTHIAVIQAVTDHLTGGQGHVVSISRIQNEEELWQEK